MNSRLLFNASAIVEVLTGLALLVAPQFVIGLLLGEGVGPIGVAAWASKGQDIRLAQRAGLCIYNIGAALVLTILGSRGGMNGLLLWPAAVLHALIGAMMLSMILLPSQKAAGD